MKYILNYLQVTGVSSLLYAKAGEVIIPYFYWLPLPKPCIMKDYREFQFGWLIFVFVLPAHGFIIYAFITGWGSKPIDTSGIIIANVVFISIYLLFYGMRTKITQETLTVSFGIGLIKKKIQLTRIKSAKETHNNYLYGWGIRFIPNGMLYNISGNEAVELKFADTKKVVRVGTQNTDALKAEILKRIPSLS